MKYGNQLAGSLAGEELAGVIANIGNRHSIPFSADDPNTWRRQTVPMNPVTIADGSTGKLVVNPQDIFKVEKISIPPLLDATTGIPITGVYITDVKVGSQNQLPAEGKMDIRVFDPKAVNSGVDYDTGNANNQFVITVENNSGVEIEITATAFALIAKKR